MNQKPPFFRVEFYTSLLQWGIICLLTGVTVGVIGGYFLAHLSWATTFRENNLWIIFTLPISGLLVGYLYHKYGGNSSKGNNLLIDEYHQPSKTIPLIMAPLVYLGTILTHLSGGSAGREGTAVQVGGSLADNLLKWLRFKNVQRKDVLTMGVAAGFSAVFGTPLAGTVFALEIFTLGKITHRSLVPTLVTSLLAYYVVELMPVAHTQYQISEVVHLDTSSFLYVLLASVLFGLAAMLFTYSFDFFKAKFNLIKTSYFRPFVGGLIFCLVVYFTDTYSFIGLGIDSILEAFQTQNTPYDFLIKLLFTAFTLAAGFKGGEVTPLFFIGATLGSALSLIFPLPVSLLAGVGFVSVFSAATKTPIACSIMGFELFGMEAGLFITLGCFVAFVISGKKGIYDSQLEYIS